MIEWIGISRLYKKNSLSAGVGDDRSTAPGCAALRIVRFNVPRVSRSRKSQTLNMLTGRGDDRGRVRLLDSPHRKLHLRSLRGLTFGAERRGVGRLPVPAVPR